MSQKRSTTPLIKMISALFRLQTIINIRCEVDVRVRSNCTSFKVTLNCLVNLDNRKYAYGFT